MVMKVDYVARETVTNLRRNLLLTVASVLTVAVSLGLVGGALLLRQGVDNATARWQGGIEFEIFLNPDVAPDQSEAVARELNARPEVERVQFVSQEEAYEEFQVLFHNRPEFLENVGPADLPPSYRVVPAVSDADAIDALGRSFEGRPGVKQVVFAKETVDMVLRVTRFMNYGIFAVAAILLFAACLLIFNTIRMAIFARRREIEVMKLVGATNWFIRVPFMTEGLIQGLVGGAVAFGCVWSLWRWGVPWIATVPIFEGFVVTGSQLGVTTGFIVGVGALVGAIGSGVAVTRFLDV